MAIASVLKILPMIEYSTINSIRTVLSENNDTFQAHDVLLDPAVHHTKESLRSHYNGMKHL